MNKILQQRIEEAAKTSITETLMSTPNYEFSPKATDMLECAYIKGAEDILNNQWISVDEALPEYEECVLAHFEGEDEVGAMFSQRSKPSDNLILDKNGFQVVGFTEVTHWMSIPKLKEGKK